MSPQETAQIIALIKRSYPSSYKDYDDQQMAETVLIWSDLFKDYPFDVVQKALKNFIMTNNTNWAPSPGQLNKIIAESIEVQTESLDKYQAWEMVVNAMKSSAYNSESQFNKLPESVQRCIGNSQILKSWALMDFERLDFVQNRFYKRFEEEKEIEHDRLLLPDVLSQKIKELSGTVNDTVKKIAE